jgi:hypothetical protein
MVILIFHYFCNLKGIVLEFEQSKLAVLTALAACVLGAAAPVDCAWAAGWVQHGDDSVRRNGEVSQPEVPPRQKPAPLVVISPQAHYLMQHAVLTSSIGLNEVRFSGYKNNSPYSLVISLEFAGAAQDKHSSVGIVNGVAVNWSNYVTTFDVPPGANYGFNVQSTYVISAWMVAGIDEEVNKAQWAATQLQTGLPTAAIFKNPIRQGHTYRGCVENRMNGQPTENYYYYLPGRWTDGADPIRDAEIVPEFGWVVRAGAPLNPGRCSVVRDTQVNAPESGGGL